jgi:preprotein translocase subunit SecE
MAEDINTPVAGTADKAKLIVAVLVVIAGVAAFYVLTDQPVWMRWAAVAASLVLAAVVIAFSRYGTEFRRFVELARIELRKIVWPTREETGKMTAVVLMFVVVAGIFFWLLDLVLAWATKTLTGQGG